MIFRPKRKKLNSDIDIHFEGEKIQEVTYTKFLGVILDNNLTWNHTASKIAKCIGVICKARQYLNNYYLINLYHAFMLPYMNCCIHVWGGTSSSTLAPIFRIQKIAIRCLLKMKKTELHFRCI